ncbi:Proline dipeptidase [Alkalibacterium sp. AK22]|uniref:aminopeptidase P family protein n=1 Tax=Alkalibacterium sp. AK22 TaxID=1229520 RepID=UPI00044FE276|nr:Xaa-Pro peptidase family protein [Alkalibacterium sp. AK22]EXJ23154.1 Proline dipeptidase [Alkalibacterium sp. AK22]
MTPLNTLQQKLKQQTANLFYTDSPQTIAYLTNFYSDPHERILALFVYGEDSVLLVPELEVSEARKNEHIGQVIGYRDEENAWHKLRHAPFLVQAERYWKIGIETDQLVVERYEELQSLFPAADFINFTPSINEMKMVKSAEEIQKLLKAGELADQALEIGMAALKTGVSEREIVALIEFEMKKRGASSMSFDTMVLFGDHAASPHGTPGERKLVEDEPVLFDLGVIYDGYASDVTRTVMYGKASEAFLSAYSSVLNAQRSAQEQVSPGVTTGELDQIARELLTKDSFGQYFTHRLGHGIGQSVHEYPNIAAGTDLPLCKGMCFSLEPGVYIKGQFGIRIEDCVALTDKGPLAFTQTSKELITLPLQS